MKKIFLLSTILLAGLILAYSTPFLAFGAETLIDSYSIDNVSSHNYIQADPSYWWAVGQSININKNINLTKIKLNIGKQATNPTSQTRIGLYRVGLDSQGYYGVAS